MGQNETSQDVEVVYFLLDVDSTERASYYPSLSEEEKLRAQRYRFDLHRNRYICKCGKLREALAGIGRCSPNEIKFKVQRYGKPYISFPESLQRIQFNTSSSGSIGAVAWAIGTPVGLDVERIEHEKDRNFDLVAEKEFTHEEYDWLRRHHGPIERDRAFYALWTCKEAYLKGLGIGLSGELNKFSVDMQGPTPTIVRTELENTDRLKLYLRQLYIGDDVVACLASALPKCSVRIKTL